MQVYEIPEKTVKRFSLSLVCWALLVSSCERAQSRSSTDTVRLGANYLPADTSDAVPAEFVAEGNPEPQVPFYYRDICPGEICLFGQWLVCDTARVLKEAKAGSPTAFVLHPNDTITALTGDVIVSQAGKVVFTQPVRVDMEGMHALFTPADTLYPLLYTGEGFGTWWFRGKEREGFLFFGKADDSSEIAIGSSNGSAVIRATRHEWWVKVRNKNGQTGWFIPPSGIRGMVPSSEDGPFACS